jgi:hypothetical protein
MTATTDGLERFTSFYPRKGAGGQISDSFATRTAA